jgi:hypothetical protein
VGEGVGLELGVSDVVIMGVGFIDEVELGVGVGAGGCGGGV